MKLLQLFGWIVFFLAFSGCNAPRKGVALDKYNQGSVAYNQGPQQERQAQAQASVTHEAAKGGGGGGSKARLQMASLADAGTTTDRKIIRNAELSIELDSPTEGQRKVTAIAEAHGGFVVTSEFRQNEGGQVATNSTVTVAVRVPSMQFAAVVQEIESIGGRVKQRKITGQDVTEEYIDLEARIRTQRALEAQFLEIMKQAHKVSDALEVQSQLAEVRTEIERLEGRRRFLENQSALSTITVTLQTPAPVVAATTAGFFQSVKQAVGNSIDLSTDIILGLISLVIVMIPILLFIVLPGFLLWRFFSRRWFKKTPLPETE